MYGHYYTKTVELYFLILILHNLPELIFCEVLVNFSLLIGQPCCRSSVVIESMTQALFAANIPVERSLSLSLKHDITELHKQGGSNQQCLFHY